VPLTAALASRAARSERHRHNAETLTTMAPFYHSLPAGISARTLNDGDLAAALRLSTEAGWNQNAHAQLSAVRLVGDVNATMTDNASLDELLDKINDELRKLGPLIDLEAIREPRGSRNKRGLSKSVLPAGRSGT
jgi:hypothetical protein